MTETDRRLAARRLLWEDALRGCDLVGKRALDAGTGEGHATRFLAERRPAALVSVSAVAEDFRAAAARLGELAANVEFRLADLTRLTGIADASFDVVFADFLIAAVSAFAPYREIECLAELVRVLKPGGRLVITGWELVGPPRDPLDQRLRLLFSLREAASRLAGEASYREHPAWWIAARLADLDTPAERTVVHPDVHRDFRWFGGQIRRLLEGLEPPLAAALRQRLADLEAGVVDHPAFAAGYEFGALYAVVATGLRGGVRLGP